MQKRLKMERLESRELLAADLIITEFMASNGNSLEDGNGAASDWIEIYNAGDQSADLVGYSLTDNADDLNKWVFPTSTVLAPGHYLVVFASGNNTPDSAGNLHTNFSLSAGGEYLALVDPLDNVLSEYGPGGTDYPQQFSDISYGLGFNLNTQTVVTPASSVTYLRPTNSSVDATWMQPSFNDATWSTGVASLGYETFGNDFAGLISTAIPSGTSTAYVRIPFNISELGTMLGKLQMKYDDGFVAYLNGQVIASANAPGTLAWNSIATSDHPDGLAVNFVDFPVSEYSNLLVQGENILAIHMLNRFSSSSDMLASIQLTTTTGGSTSVGPLQAPTPGAPNSNLRASDVVFSHVGGAYLNPFSLVLSTSDPTEQIRYTTNGTVPTASSPLYTGPISVSTNVQIRARAFGPQGQVGTPHTETFTRTTSTTAAFTSDLPIIVLENFGAGTPGTLDFEDAVMSLYEIDESTGRASLANGADLSTLIGQHRRGRSTANNPKTNLRIEIRDEAGEDKAVELLGMPSESDWVLYAPYSFDRAMIRDTTFFELSRQMGNWAPRTRFVEVYANYDGDTLHEDDYMGVYVLMENIKRDSNRVDIAELTPTQNTAPDITGGYIFALDGIDGETPAGSAWKTERNIPTLGDSWLVFDDPDYQVLTEAQIQYLRNYVQDFEDALYGPNSTDPLLGYQAYFDVDASIDHHMIRLLSKEPDSLRLSTYLTKDRDGKMAFGPLWDFDRSAGGEDGRSASPEGWTLPDVNFFESDWWGPLFDDPNFAQRWVDRWQELRQGVLSDASLEATMDGMSSQLTEAQVRNFARWSNVAPNGGAYADPGTTGWDAEVSHFKNWMLIRANWIDEQLVLMPSLSPPPGSTTLGQQIVLSAAPGSIIYYTLDGSDPRESGGGISPNAIQYTGPITTTGTTLINARAFGSAGSSVVSNSSFPNNEEPFRAVDQNPNTKYLNFAGANSGIIITPNFGSSTVRSFQLTTANDAEGRDPSSWVLYGTNDAITSANNSTGLAENWVEIDSGTVSLPSARFTDGPVVTVDNATAYTSYKLVFPTVKNANNMQVADIKFFQSTNGTGTQILAAGDAALAVHTQLSNPVAAMTEWSALVTGLYSVEVPADASNFRISELHFHPADPSPSELAARPDLVADDYEFIEFINIGTEAISLNGVSFGTGIVFDFTTSSVTTVQPGETVLVVKNIDAFTLRYGTGFNIAGSYTSGNLSNSGEALSLFDSLGNPIHEFTYDDAAPWPTTADGDGPSMEVIDLLGNYADGNNWRASAVAGGTPGVHITLAGDYDFSGTVDAGDYAVWKSTYGSTTQLAADGNGNGRVDLGDYTIWRDNLGATFTPPPVVAPIVSPVVVANETADQPIAVVAPMSDEVTAVADPAPSAFSTPSYPLDGSSTGSKHTTSTTASTSSAGSSSNSANELLLLDLAFSRLDDAEGITVDFAVLESDADDQIGDFEMLSDELLSTL
ncbi:CotH kinase family protein [Aeoliella sp. SH292]|uniref:CotH kinase family protein n=1 Tax=Aeoliella sp. SH292 TaxID=3454464 RepID=UPI003F9E6BB2